MVQRLLQSSQPISAEIKVRKTVDDLENHSPLKNLASKLATKLAPIVLLGVLAATLTAGLIPRGSFTDNWLSWNETDRRTVFKEYGMVYGNFPSASALNDAEGLLLEIALTPQKSHDNLFRVITHIGAEGDPNPFILGQWRTQLIFLQGYDFANKTKSKRFGIDVTAFLNQSVNISIQLHSVENRLSINGEAIRHHAPSEYHWPMPNSLISIGNSPEGKLGWSGEISAFKVFKINSEYEPTVLLRDYAFNKDFKRSIEDLSNSDEELSVPKPGRFPALEVLHSVPLEELLRYSRVDLVLNLLGFIPLGVAAAGSTYFANRTRPFFSFLSAFLLCLVVSLTIELLQPLIPGRHSHLHDFILNLGGGFIGILGVTLVFILFTNHSRCTNAQYK